MTASNTSNKELAAKGISLLGEAVLLVLLQARREGKCLGGTEIARMLDIPIEKGTGAFGNAITSGILVVLESENKAEQTCQRLKQDGMPMQSLGWQITEKEFQARQGKTTKGMAQLEEEILQVLFQAKREGKCLGATEIARILEIPIEGGSASFSNAITAGVLDELARKNKAEKTCRKIGKNGQQLKSLGWQLTDTEFLDRQRKK